ncbi:DUF58 domain-containing protein [Microbulbifer hydrolyticus]|uniref:DUF58 domain-containing protein n=1 Tax=Microbulbifer hydrolyticus TaxID=48074 RepID=A0A6P1T818_9GAMM|nr:DUF58 domain-containing protein [Microbulbifer hydrolyticus]MBB5210589.1 uncharacterized protein (DUF58 family) [Microbulbifer hydrolyticus]QHQ38944.1 DUF58 domain-containing protein [Microbulbifer hydrolyticus]
MQKAINHNDLNIRGAYPEVAPLVRLRHIARQLRLFKPRVNRSDQAGNLLTRYRGRGMNFEEVRYYQPGDDVRSIDWRVTARTGKTHTKLFQEERERPVVILLDLRSPMFFGSQNAFKSVAACSIASALCWAGLQHGDRIGALLFSDHGVDTVRPRRSHHAVLAAIHGMVETAGALDSPIASGGSQPLSVLLEEARRIARPGSALFLISDCHDMDESCEQPLYLLTRHADLQVLRITDPLEQQLPEQAMTISDGKQRTFLGKSSRALRQQFANHQYQVREQTAQLCRRLHLPLVDFDNTQPVVPLLLSTYGDRQPSPNRSPA